MWSLIIFLVLRCLVSLVFGPRTPTGGCVGAFPPTIVAGGSRGGEATDVRDPLAGVRGKHPQKEIYMKNAL
jgi:hypothetical protein